MDTEDEKGTPARDTPDAEDFGGQDEQAVSDQQGEVGSPGARPTEGDDED